MAEALPEVFRARLREILAPDHYQACWQSFAVAATAFRANGLKTNADALRASCRMRVLRWSLLWKPDVFLVLLHNAAPLPNLRPTSMVLISRILQHGAAAAARSAARRVDLRLGGHERQDNSNAG